MHARAALIPSRRWSRLQQNFRSLIFKLEAYFLQAFRSQRAAESSAIFGEKHEEPAAPNARQVCRRVPLSADRPRASG